MKNFILGVGANGEESGEKTATALLQNFFVFLQPTAILSHYANVVEDTGH